MKTLFIILFVGVISTSCTKKMTTIVEGKNGDSCVAIQVVGGIEITCGANSVFLVDGTDGKDGIDGVDGINGQDGAKGDQGEKGDVGEKGEQGEPGKNGKDGEKGDKGEDSSFVFFLEICPKFEGNFKEILLVVKNGNTHDFLAFLSNNDYKQQRLVIVPKNQTFITTDGRNVEFHIHSNGNKIKCMDGTLMNDYDQEVIFR